MSKYYQSNYWSANSWIATRSREITSGDIELTRTNRDINGFELELELDPSNNSFLSRDPLSQSHGIHSFIPPAFSRRLYIVTTRSHATVAALVSSIGAHLSSAHKTDKLHCRFHARSGRTSCRGKIIYSSKRQITLRPRRFPPPPPLVPGQEEGLRGNLGRSPR